ncbi:hypothetical protein L9F63_008246, partial [Diploptera punctata]
EFGPETKQKSIKINLYHCYFFDQNWCNNICTTNKDWDNIRIIKPFSSTNIMEVGLCRSLKINNFYSFVRVP